MAGRIYITPREREALARIAHAEAASINHPSRYTSIADSITNREAAGSWYGGSTEAILNKKKQYTPINGLGTWEALSKAPQAVSSEITRHLSERAFGAPPTEVAKNATHYLNVAISDKKNVQPGGWAAQAGGWPSIGTAPVSHAFGNPDNVSIPDHTISLSPQIQAEMSGVYSNPQGMIGGNTFGQIAAPSDPGALSFSAPADAKATPTSAFGAPSGPVMAGSLAGLGPQTGAFDNRYRNPEVAAQDMRASDIPASTPFGAAAAPVSAPAPKVTAFSSPPAMFSPQSSVVNPGADAVAGAAPSAQTAFGAIPSASGFADMYGAPPASAPFSAMGVPSAPTVATSPAPSAPSPMSVQSMSMPGLTDQQIGMGAPPAAVDANARVASAFGSMAPPAVSAPSAPSITARIAQAHDAAPAPNATGGFGGLAGMQPSGPQVASLGAPPAVSAPSMTMASAAPTPQSPSVMSGMATMPGALSPMAASLQQGPAVASLASLSAPTSFGAPPSAPVSAPSQSPSPSFGMAPSISAPVSGPSPVAAAPMSISAPRIAPISAQKQAEQASQQSDTGSTSGGVAAPSVSMTAGAKGAGAFARASAAQVASKGAASAPSAGPKAGSKAGGTSGSGGGGGGTSGGSGGSSGGGSAGASSGGSKSGGVGHGGKAHGSAHSKTNGGKRGTGAKSSGGK